MKKELDAFSLDFAVELQDYPVRNTFPSRKGKSEMFCFPSGYYSFDKEGKMDGCHLYVQDYQGNNRMVVNAYTDEVEQINHYYPYGALMADISTNPDAQKYKFGGKELDRKFGLDLHDFEARQQDPLVGRFTSIDPMAEKYYSISPYAYCAGDPINLIDPTGMTYKLSKTGEVSDNKDGNRTLLKASDGKKMKITASQADVLDGLIESQKANTPDQASSPTRAFTKSTKINLWGAVSLYRFLAKHTSSEWSLTGLFKTEKMSAAYIFSTSFNRRTVNRSGTLSEEDKTHIKFDIHSHPESNYPSTDDYSTAYLWYRSTWVESAGEIAPRFYIYRPGDAGMFEYDPKGNDYTPTKLNPVNSDEDMIEKIR